MIGFVLGKKQLSKIAKQSEAKIAEKIARIKDLKEQCSIISANNAAFKAAYELCKSIAKEDLIILPTKEYSSKDGYTGSTDAIFPVSFEKGKYYLAETSNYWRGNSNRDRTQLFNDQGNLLFDRLEGDYLDHEEPNAGICLSSIFRHLHS